MANDPSKIALALVQLFPGRDFESFLRDPRFSSVTLKTSIWVNVCNIIQPARHVITLRKNIRKCYDTFRHKFNDIKSVYKNLESAGALAAANYTKGEGVNNNSVRLLSSDSYKRDVSFPIARNVLEAEKTTLCVSSEKTTYKTRCKHSNSSEANCTIDTWSSNFDDIATTNEETTSRDSNTYIEQGPCKKVCSSGSSLTKKRTTGLQRSERATYTEDEGFVIPKEFWMKYRSFERQLRNGWVESFLQYVKSVERYSCCVFKVNYHRCYEARKKCKVHFYASVQCKNSMCTAYRFEAEDPITTPFKDVEIKVFREKAIEHDGSEIHRRFIRGEQRDRFRNLLQIDKPSVVRTKKIQEVPAYVLRSGNRDDAPSLTLLQKISSENETKQDLDRDPLVHLQKRAELYRKDPKWHGNPVVGYIQDLFNCIAFTEKQILHLLSLTPKNKVFCYLDATGSIASKLPHSDKRVFYYALVLPGCARLDHEYGPMPLAEFLSNTHTVPQITYFLSTVNHAIKQYTTRKVVIKKIETDFSIALIAAVLKSFNDMTIFRYLHALYVLLTAESFQTPGFTLVHVCSSHMLKTVQRKSKDFFLNSYQHSYAAVLMTKLIHADTMTAAIEAFTMVVVIFGLPYKVPMFDSYVKEMKTSLRKETKEKENNRAAAKEEADETLIKSTRETLIKKQKRRATMKENEQLAAEEEFTKKKKGQVTNQGTELTKERTEEKLRKEIKEQVDEIKNEGEGVEESDEEDDLADISLKYDVELFDEAECGRKDSPFYQCFATHYDKVRNETLPHVTTEKNELYCEEFVNYLLLYILPYYPLWSAVVIVRFNLLRDSNATVENYFKIIKNIVLQKKLNISAPRFFSKVEQLLAGWLRERNYPLVTNRQKMGRIRRSMPEAAHEDENLATEEFKPDRPKRRKESIYFPKSKYVQNEMIHTNSSSSQRNSVRVEPAEAQKNCPSESEQVAVPEKSNPTIIDIENDNVSCNVTGTFDQDLDTRFLKETSYPPNFPHYRKNVGGIELNPTLFARLLPDVWLDGEIINSFFFDLQEIAESNSLNLLAFDSYFSTKILKGETSIGFARWAKKVQPLKFDIWLLPVLIHDCHWTLLVVMLTHRVMIYFDSCHQLPPQILVDRICSFIASSRLARCSKLTQWKSWQFSAPIDTPSQINDFGETTGNCGMHVCLWAYAIVSQSYACFEEKHMNAARRGLAKLLVEFLNSKKKNDERVAIGEDLFESYDSVPELINMFNVIPVTRSPPLAFESTSHFVASIKTLIDIAKE